MHPKFPLPNLMAFAAAFSGWGCRGLVITAALAATLAAPLASAAYIGALSFVEPTGTVGTGDSIPVWLRLTLDSASDPLEINNDANGSPPFGVLPANYPSFRSLTLDASGLVYELVSVDYLTRVDLSTSYGCSGTFYTCPRLGDPEVDAYEFNFNSFGPDSLASKVPFSLLPGQSVDYLFGNFTPIGGAAAPGTYYFYSALLGLRISGVATWRIRATDESGLPINDEFGNPVYLPDLRSADFNTTGPGGLRLASTPCGFSADPSCAGNFSRTVVPVPAAVWLFSTGIGVLAWRGRRRIGC